MIKNIKTRESIHALEKRVNQLILDWFKECVDIGDKFLRYREVLYYDGIDNGCITFKRQSGAYISYTPQAIIGTLKDRKDDKADSPLEKEKAKKNKEGYSKEKTGQNTLFYLFFALFLNILF